MGFELFIYLVKMCLFCMSGCFVYISVCALHVYAACGCMNPLELDGLRHHEGAEIVIQVPLKSSTQCS